MAEIPLDLLDTIRQLQDRLRFLEGRAQIRPALTQIAGGDVSVSAGGRLIVTTPTGNQILYIGKQSPSHSDGSDQQGLVVRREDNSVALSIWTSSGTGAQPIVVWDKNGASILADDLVAGGLASPYIGISGWFGATEQPTATTTGGAFVSVAHLPWIKQHPRIEANYLVRCSDGATSGEIRLVDDVGNQVGPTVTVGLGGYTYSSLTGTLAGGFQQRMYLHWQARTTAGTGTIGVKGLSTFGIQS